MPSTRSSSGQADGENRLGAFLRTRRDRLRPDEVGLPPGARRRAPGLRREEVAALCQISPTWYTWIEQGRTTAVSEATLHALADGLRLTQAERAYLFELGGRSRDHQAGPQAMKDTPDRPALQALVDAIKAPAYVLDRHWDALAWNRAAGRLFASWLGPRRGEGGPADRNLLRWLLVSPDARAMLQDWPQRLRRVVAEYRADTAAWGDDPAGQALVSALRTASPDFDEAWRAQDVLAREGGLRTFVMKDGSRCTYLQTTLHPAERTDLKLTVLLPQPADVSRSSPRL